MQDDALARLLSSLNRMITSCQARFTSHALILIARTTLRNPKDIEQVGSSATELRVSK